MTIVRTALTRLFTLSVDGRSFFYVTSLMHVAFKMLLGLVVVFEDGYGMRTWPAPPQSLIFAANDVTTCFVVSRALDLIPWERARQNIHSVMLALLVPYLGGNFIIHTYFKSFASLGLLEFNGADFNTLADYTLAALNRYSVAFLALATAIATLWIAMRVQLRASPWLARPVPPVVALAVAIGLVPLLGSMSVGQSGWLRRNPGFHLVSSFIWRSTLSAPSASAQEAASFRADRAPLFGRYDNALDLVSPKRPKANVLFVLIESLPLEQTALGGAPDGLPVLKELAADAIVFDNFRTVFPATSRSFLTYHCGIYPNTGSATATRVVPRYRCASIVKTLEQAGYRTGFFTASMFTYDNLHKAEVVTDYDEYKDFLTLHDRAKNNGIDAPAVEEELVVDSLLEFVDAAPKQPFFATYFMFWNHAPYRLPFEDISGLAPLDRYRRTLSYLDQVLRSLLQQLERRGLRDDTIIVVSADHGEGFGLHHDNVNHVGHIYEDDVHVPFMIHIKGIGSHHTARQGSNVDFARTLAALLDLPAHPTWSGQDLLAAEFAPRPLLLFGRAEHLTNGIVDGNLKYIEYPQRNTRMLFDLSQDPLEQHDLSAEQSVQSQRYHELVETWLPVVEQRAWSQPSH